MDQESGGEEENEYGNRSADQLAHATFDWALSIIHSFSFQEVEFEARRSIRQCTTKNIDAIRRKKQSSMINFTADIFCLVISASCACLRKSVISSADLF